MIVILVNSIHNGFGYRSCLTLFITDLNIVVRLVLSITDLDIVVTYASLYSLDIYIIARYLYRDLDIV